MKKRNLFLAALICSLGLSIAGCGNQELTLTENEQQLVAEYAASVLMQYNAGSNMRVLTGKRLELAETEEQARKEQEAKRQQAAMEYQNGRGTASATTTTTTTVGGAEGIVTSTTAVQNVTAIEDLGNFFAADGFSITYQNYEVTDSYADPQEGDLMMSMDATAGRKLLVAHFSVTNNSREAAMLDVLSLGGKFRLKIDGETLQSQYTLLLNDLSMYKGEIEAGATIDTVLVFEISEEQVSPSQLELTVSLGEQKGTINLQ